MSTRRYGSVVLAAAAAIVLSACGSSVDSAELEQEIQTQLENEVGEALESVDCPEDINGDEGSSFQCTLTDLNGQTLDVQGTFTDSEGSFEVEVEGG